MHKFILGLAGFMLFVLIIATVFYYKDTKELTYPPYSQINNEKQPEQTQTPDLQPVNVEDTITYSLDNDDLNISYNRGETWTKVPVEKELLFSGEYNGNKQTLIEDSYILKENRAGFLYSDGPSWDNQSILFVYSTDRGETWEESLVKETYSVMRFRKVDFLNEDFGYIIISGGRTMSAEGSHVFLTHDGGKSWEETSNSEVTRLISDGGFVDELTGFLSFGTINPEEPDLYVTENGGVSWNKAKMIIPEEYEQIFVTAEVPVKSEEELTVLVNQGPNGDYKGGSVKGKFISNDNGKTWNFAEEVEPNE